MLKEFVVPIMTIIFAAVYYLTTKSYSIESVKFPYGIFVITIVLAVMIVINEYREKKPAPHGEVTQKKDEKLQGTFDRKVLIKPVVILIMSLLYVYLLTILGYIIPTLAFLIIAMWFLKVPKKLIFIIPPIATMAIFGIFVVWLGLPLPKGLVDLWILNLS